MSLADWRGFFERDHALYVNARHKLLHDQLIAKGVASYVISPKTRALDYGCGQARFAQDVAQRCAVLYLFDTSHQAQGDLLARYRDAAGLVVLEDDTLTEIDDGSLDLIVIVSVVQYLGSAEMDRLLARFHDKLRVGGRLVLADIVPKGLSPLEDARALLAFGARGGFFFAALFGLARTYFSDYREMRAQLGLSTYDNAEMIALLQSHGFSAQRARENIGHNQKRMTFVAEKIAAEGD